MTRQEVLTLVATMPCPHVDAVEFVQETESTSPVVQAAMPNATLLEVATEQFWANWTPADVRQAYRLDSYRLTFTRRLRP